MGGHYYEMFGVFKRKLEEMGRKGFRKIDRAGGAKFINVVRREPGPALALLLCMAWGCVLMWAGVAWARFILPVLLVPVGLVVILSAGLLLCYLLLGRETIEFDGKTLTITNAMPLKGLHGGYPIDQIVSVNTNPHPHTSLINRLSRGGISPFHNGLILFLKDRKYFFGKGLLPDEQKQILEVLKQFHKTDENP